MKLSLHISTSEDDSDNNPDIDDTAITEVLEGELGRLYPASRNFEGAEISLTFMTPEEIRELNRQYRGVDEATDVLSFPMIDDEDIAGLPELFLGDIVICPEETARLHPELGEREAIYLMIAHSFLHLLGYDHATEGEQAEMWELQDGIKAAILERSRA